MSRCCRGSKFSFVFLLLTTLMYTRIIQSNSFGINFNEALGDLFTIHDWKIYSYVKNYTSGKMQQFNATSGTYIGQPPTYHFIGISPVNTTEIRVQVDSAFFGKPFATCVVEFNVTPSGNGSELFFNMWGTDFAPQCDICPNGVCIQGVSNPL